MNTHSECNLVVGGVRAGRRVFILLPDSIVIWNSEEANVVHDWIGRERACVVGIPLVEGGSGQISVVEKLVKGLIAGHFPLEWNERMVLKDG